MSHGIARTNKVTKALTLDDDNSATDVDACFTVTGTVKLHALYLEVTGGTTLTNATAVYFDLYSANGSTVLTKADGALSGKDAGFMMYKNDVLTVTGAYIDPTAAPVVTEEATADLSLEHECFVTEDRTAGAHVATTIRLHHTSSDTGPAHNQTVIVHCEWEAKSADGALVAV